MDFARRVRPEIITGYEARPPNFEIPLEEGRRRRNNQIEFKSVRRLCRGYYTERSLRFVSYAMSLPLVNARTFDDPVESSDIFNPIQNHYRDDSVHDHHDEGESVLLLFFGISRTRQCCPSN
jgi:hypothetical protein